MKRKLAIQADSLTIDGAHVRNFIITEYPQYAIAGLMENITHGPHIENGVVVNFAIHMKRAQVTFNTQMKWKMDRLQANIRSFASDLVSESARREEEDALRALAHFKELSHGAGVFADVWLAVAITAPNAKALETSCKQFVNQMETLGFLLSAPKNLQDTVLSLTWTGGNALDYWTKHPGRTMDMDALGALYPFVDGSISDKTGCYIGHRVSDNTAVYKDFKIGSDDQNMIFVGRSGSGKSVSLKAMVISLLIEGFKGYIYDVDGEYRNLCSKVNGAWCDYTLGSGNFVDTTIIEPSIAAEMDLSRCSPDQLAKIKTSDDGRYLDAAINTEAVIGMLCETFDVYMRNALGWAMTKMWQDAGIVREKPETWLVRDATKVSLRRLYDLICEGRTSAPDDEFRGGCDRLRANLWIYFEGTHCYLFQNASDSAWLRQNPLAVFHVATDANNAFDQKIGAVKIVMITHMVWQQIKRDRIKSEYFSFELYDELQRMIRNPSAHKPLYRSITTGRKFNTQVMMGFNDPSILFKVEGGDAIWDNTRLKCLFSLEAENINKLSTNANVPEEIRERWKSLGEHQYIWREYTSGAYLYDLMKMVLPESEIKQISATRGLA